MRIRSKKTPTFFKGVVLGAAVAMVTLIGSAAVAGTGIGKVFNLGQDNRVNARSQLEGSTPSAVLKVTNSNTSAPASGVAIDVPAANPPLVVNSSTKVKNLNVDLLDGADSSAFQHQVTGSCANHTAVSAVNADGSVTCTRSAIFAIHHSMGPGDTPITDTFPATSLGLVNSCVGTNNVGFVFRNFGPGNAFLSYMYGLGGLSTVTTNSTAVVSEGSVFGFSQGQDRIVGQFIWADSQETISLNLTEFNTGGGCEYDGTAVVAPRS